MEYRPDANLDIISQLPDCLKEVLEQAAKQVHDTWAAGRLSDGWTWGESLDEVKKTHPCLIPYEDLSETEKSYDRRTAAITIRCLLDMGFLNRS